MYLIPVSKCKVSNSHGCDFWVPQSDPMLQADSISFKISCAGSFLNWKTALLNLYVQTLL